MVRPEPGPHKNKAQVTLELALGLIVVFLFFGAIIRFFLWTNREIISSQQRYQQSRGKVINNIDSAAESDFVKFGGFAGTPSGDATYEDYDSVYGLEMDKNALHL